ncbi:MAG TPA: SRPBCC family protein [Rhizomicrobium sp.]|jgi:uncharacterized protein YndB with AHSA1/START domain|nr:SRPBCC family protein [Rhizomicrobium sp.]
MIAAHGAFTIRREYPASVAAVFRAFSDIEAKARWFAPPVDCTNLIREQDFRVGGRERLSATWPGGRVSDFRAEYRDIVENRRIVYVYDLYIDGRKISVSLATVTFESVGAGTKLTVTEQGAFLDGYEDGGARERGTNDLLDALGRSLNA